MRTTIAVDDNILRAAKLHARRLGKSLGEFIELAVRHELARQADPQRERPPIPAFTRGTGLRPGVDITSNRALIELLDEGTRVEGLR